MGISDFPQIRELSISEKLLLVEELWSEIAAESELIEIPDWHKRELDQSLEDYKRSPRGGSSWTEVKGRILSRG
jgi:putative addiction module component (TIGR02574 family)